MSRFKSHIDEGVENRTTRVYSQDIYEVPEIQT